MNRFERIGHESFPLTFDLKVIMLKGPDIESSRTVLETILTRLEIRHSDWKTKAEPGSRYVRYSVTVTLPDRNTMDVLYSELGKEERIKAAI